MVTLCITSQAPQINLKSQLESLIRARNNTCSELGHLASPVTWPGSSRLRSYAASNHLHCDSAALWGYLRSHQILCLPASADHVISSTLLSVGPEPGSSHVSRCLGSSNLPNRPNQDSDTFPNRPITYLAELSHDSTMTYLSWTYVSICVCVMGLFNMI